ncbi:winged helix-turn-helix domain-containing protein [Streptomyces rectiviolaceus]
MILNLVPARGWTPDFLAPTGVGSIPELLERVRFTPRSQIRADLALMAQWEPIPPWARNLPNDAELLQRVYDSLDQVCAVVLSPYWTQITNAATADQGVRMRQTLTGGMEGILASLDPRRIRWHPPVLEVALLSGRDDDLHLAGRGLLLVPTVFGAGTPAIDTDAAPQPVMSFPVRSDHLAKTQSWLIPPAQSGPPTSDAALAALLGHTRAAVLTAIAEHPGCSTKELAAHTGITSPSASEHATVLRTAGLISTIRHRNTALHSPTHLGTGLLNT